MSKAIPKLRFREFNEQWQKFELGTLTRKISVGIATEVRPFVSQKGDVPLIRNQNIKVGYFDDSSIEYITPNFDEANKTKRVQTGDVIIVRTGSNMGNACVVPERFKGSQTFTTLIVRPNSDLLHYQFLSYHINYFGLSEVQRLSAGGGKANLNAGVLKDYRITIGTEPEQQKIASFLSAVDEKIQQLTRKKELLEQYKKGVMQQLFSSSELGFARLEDDRIDADDKNNPTILQSKKSKFRQLRFKDENGKAYPKWEERKLGDVLDEHKMKSTGKEEVFSVSVHKGLVNQVEHLGRVFAAKNTDNYNLVKPGDLVYTKSPTGDFPLGIIKQSKLNKSVIVSPLYGVFTPETLGLGYLLHVYFESPINVTNYLASIIQKGAKNTINITNTNFLSKKMKLPVSKEEQQKIANFLSAIDTKIESVVTQIEKTQTFKKGLLQQMFV